MKDGNHFKSMLGVYLMLYYLAGMIMTLFLFGYGNNLTDTQLFVGSLLIIFGGFLGAVILGEQILQRWGNE